VVSFFFVLYTHLSALFSFAPSSLLLSRGVYTFAHISHLFMLLVGRTSFSHLQKGIPPLRIGMSIT